MNVLFWGTLSIILYTYVGYPIMQFFLSKCFPVPTTKMTVQPFVSVVIAARNEEKTIENRIQNILTQDYPEERLELIIVSDGSNDLTNAIVAQQVEGNRQNSSRDKPPIKFLSYSPAQGKPNALNKGVAEASGEIIVFTDCRQRFAPDAVQQLVDNFKDENVGAVSGELIFKETTGSDIQGEISAYWNFEKWLRKLESITGSVPGATGAIYAIRKKLFIPIPEETLLDDVLIPMNIILQGYRVIFDSQALAFDTASKNIAQEKRRKIRTLAGNLQLLILRPALLNPLKNKIFLQFLSHKIFRLLVPYCAILLVVISFFLRSLPAILVLSATCLIFIVAGLPKFGGPLNVLSQLTNVFRSFILLNYFALLAPIKLLLTPRELW